MRKLNLIWLLIGFAVSTPGAAQQLEIGRRSTGGLAAIPDIGPSSRDWMAAHFINVGQGQASQTAPAVRLNP